MTFELADYSSPVIDRDFSQSPPAGPAVLPPKFDQIKEIYNEDTEKQCRKSESRAHALGTDSSDNKLGSLDDNPIVQLIDDTYEQFESGDLDEAARNVHALISQYAECRHHIRDLVQYAISRLSTAYGPADPPHPDARTIVIRRQDLAI